MNKRVHPDRLTTHSHRLVRLVAYLMIVAVALRRRHDLAPGFSMGAALALLGLFTVLYASESWLSARIKWYPRLYFAVQFIIVETFGLFQEYQDTWAVLYVVLGFQVALRCSRREAIFWFSLYGGAMLVTLSAEFGLVSGPGSALAYGMVGVLLISYDIQYARHEDALAESQMLLAELQEAHRKLVEYVAQADELAALRERNQMVQELYDSVGQKIFAIQLAAETGRLMLREDPERAAFQLEDLGLQTQSTLAQMRLLIEQWRPV